ncbi:hypothetical protein LOTGIDRAFT_164276 [Lottia gigantea]|uniref:Chitin-binding type-2 domain-containing protein n=1 Tax=Lottia gigantea TaxID=225164 RepID=V4A5V6_LOTGI|nr:hypothetical protein LOTGIDRAFT_164276 [Lottia gigantea]ESO90355.1 hypothetical protein LOTGIDRAFT_164276 [Lottia gigantea]
MGRIYMVKGDCTYYYQCNNRREYLRRPCKDDEICNPWIGKCVSNTENVDCDIIPDYYAKSCIYQRVPSDCTKYTHCNGGLEVVEWGQNNNRNPDPQCGRLAVPTVPSDMMRDRMNGNGNQGSMKERPLENNRSVYNKNLVDLTTKGIDDFNRQISYHIL